MSRFAILFLLLSITCHADTTIKKHKILTDSNPPENVASRSDITETFYKKGPLRKRENSTASITDIANCDTRTGFLIDSDAHEYRTYKVVKFVPTAQLEEYLNNNPQSAVDIESTTVDTGEHKTFFGYPAKHFITTTKRAADKNNAGGEDIIDAWYIDHELPDNHCAPDYIRSEPYYVLGTALVLYPQLARFHHTGPVPTGLAVKITSTQKILGSNGAPDRTFTMIETVEEVSDSPLDPSLFELPAGLNENPHLFQTK